MLVIRQVSSPFGAFVSRLFQSIPVLIVILTVGFSIVLYYIKWVML